MVIFHSYVSLPEGNEDLMDISWGFGGWVDPKNGDAAKNWWLPSGKLT